MFERSGEGIVIYSYRSTIQYFRNIYIQIPMVESPKRRDSFLKSISLKTEKPKDVLTINNHQFNAVLHLNKKRNN